MSVVDNIKAYVEKDNIYKMEIAPSTENNSPTALCVHIMPATGKNGVSIPMEGIINEINGGFITEEEAGKKLIGIYVANEDEILKYSNAMDNLSKDMILDNVVYRVVNAELNAGRLGLIPHKDMLDLAVAYKVVVDSSDSNIAGFDVTHDQCNKYGISMDELDDAARRNVLKEGFEVEEMPEMLAKVSGMPRSMFENDGPEMYVLTNTLRCNGACVMLFNEEFDALADKLDDDLYVFPSSIHEVIAIPVGEKDPGKYIAMVKDINSQVVNDEEILSESVYIYNREKHAFGLVADDYYEDFVCDGDSEENDGI